MRIYDRPAGEQPAGLFSARTRDLGGRGENARGADGAADGVLGRVLGAEERAEK